MGYRGDYKLCVTDQEPKLGMSTYLTLISGMMFQNNQQKILKQHMFTDAVLSYFYYLALTLS